MMNPFSRALRPILLALALACASLAACANNPPQRTDLEYRSRAPSTGQEARPAGGSSDERLTIQSGEGERLNLPWFVRDTQEWINNN